MRVIDEQHQMQMLWSAAVTSFSQTLEINWLIDTSHMKSRLPTLDWFQAFEQMRLQLATQISPVHNIGQSPSTLAGLVILMLTSLHHLLERSSKARCRQNGALTNNKWEWCGMPRYIVSKKPWDRWTDTLTTEIEVDYPSCLISSFWKLYIEMWNSIFSLCITSADLPQHGQGQPSSWRFCLWFQRPPCATARAAVVRAFPPKTLPIDFRHSSLSRNTAPHHQASIRELQGCWAFTDPADSKSCTCITQRT